MLGYCSAANVVFFYEEIKDNLIWNKDPVSKNLNREKPDVEKLVSKETKSQLLNAILNDSKVRKAYIQLYPRQQFGVRFPN